jgi:ABC-type branched-subunit amino acid transport system ATPase component
MSDVILSVKGLCAAYGDEDVLKGVDIMVERRSIVAIIGPNGSGKSTLLKTIYGLVRARRGEVMLYDGERRAHALTALKPDRITALGLNMVPQLANVFSDMSVLENLEIGVLPIRHRFAEQRDKVLAALPLLQPMLGKRAATLSGGQRQMLALARALMSDPSLLILDEPSAGLAPRVQDEVFAKVKAINALGVQRARQCLAIADFAYVLEQGRNRLDGTARSLLHDPEVARLYLGGSRARADNRSGSR